MKSLFTLWCLGLLLLGASLAHGQVALPADLTETNCKAKLLPDKTYALFNQNVSFRFFFPRNGNNNQLPFAVTSNMFFIKVANGGSIQMTLNEAEAPYANNLDYILWGPYDNLTTPGTKVLDTPVDFVSSATYPYNNGSSVQSFNLTPRTGQYYLLFVDNVDKLARSFKMSFTSSNGGVIDASPTGDTPTISGQPASNAACTGGTLSLNVTASNATGYQWRFNNANISGATGSTYTKSNFTAANAGKYDVIVSSGSGCYALSNAAVITAGSGTTPTISGQPSGTNRCVGQSATFTVIASGSSLSYQWRKNGANIPNATSASFTIPTIATGDAGQYDVVVSGTCGTATSNPATLSLNTPVNITNQPVALQRCSGGSATFQIAASGDITGYQWRKNGVNISNATGTSLTLSNILSDDAGQYDVLVLGACGTSTSSSATLTVNTPAVITTSPTAQVLCVGGSATFSVSASGTISGYQWRKAGQAIAGATSASYTIGNASLTDAGQYDVVVSGVCANATSTAATLTVNTPVAITAQPIAQSQCQGGSVTFQVTATGTIAGYQWRKNGQAIAGATSASYTLSNVTTADAAQYEVIVKGTGPCGDLTSSGATLTVHTPVVITTSPTAQVLCVGGSATFSVSASGTISGYQWRKAGQAIAGATSASYTISNVSLTDAGQYDVVVSGVCANATSTAATLTVNTPVAITAQPIAQSQCQGGSVTFQVTATGTIAGYQWRKNGQDIAGATSASYTLSNVTTADAAQYEVIVKGTGPCGDLTSSGATLTVHTPVVITTQPISQTQCPGSNTTLLVVAGGDITGYQWRKNGQNIPGATNGSLSLSNLEFDASGDYDVVISGICNTLTSGVAKLTVPTRMVITPSMARVTCFGGSNGQASVSVSGGAGSYSYVWNNNANTALINGLTAGQYTVQVTDGLGCRQSQTIDVLQSPELTLSSSSTAVRCFGGNDGRAEVIATGGLGTYTYEWSGSGTKTATATGLAAGTYQVTVTDGNGCSKQINVIVDQPAAVALSTSSTPATCFGGNDGTATVTVSGGVGNYTYLWNTGATASQITGLLAGSYTVTVTDGNGCTKTSTVVVGQPATLLTLTTSSVPTKCFGGSDGTATVTATGGGTSYSYSWTGGSTLATATGLGSGTYQVTVTDNNGCVKSASANVSQPAVVALSTSSTPALCFGSSDGTATVTASGGVGNYTYQWANSAGVPGAKTATATGLAAGTYQVTVTDGNGCEKTSTVVVSQPAMVALSTSSTPALCFGSSDGTATVTASGGVGNYTYQWANSAGVLGARTATATGLAAGTYSVTVTDGNGCEKTSTVAVSQPAVVALSTSSTPALCLGSSDGTATVTASGGVGTYTYQWANSAGVPGAKTATGLAAGTYSVTVTDGNGCAKTSTVVVGQPATLLTLDTSSVPTKCFGGSDGTATVTATGGGTSYSYSWTGGSTLATATGLAAGTYQVTVTDNNGCIKSASANVSQPAVVALSTSSTPALCFGSSDGTATVTASGGVGNYTYQWANSAGVPGAKTATATGLAAGTYSVTVTDGNGCVQSARVEVTQPTPIVLGTSSTSATCFGGSDGTATVTASGGVGNYTYQWANSAGVPGARTATATGLAAGTYSVTVTDGNGCAKATSLFITQPTAISLSISSTPASCFGGNEGSASVTASGGSGSYTYRWSNGESGATTAAINGILAGTYSVTVTDGNGCRQVASVVVAQPATLLTLTTSSTSVSCFNNTDGAVRVTVAGGGSNYTYLWNGPTSAGATTASLTRLFPGTYTVTVSDDNGCVKSASVDVAQPTGVAIATSTTAVTCFGESNGVATVTAGGGVGNYTYRWSTGSTSATIDKLAAGTYTVTVTDGNGCVSNVSAVVTQPTQVKLTTTTTDVTCFGSSNGAATVVASGGMGSYTYRWTGPTATGATTASISGLVAGMYTVTVTDGNGCVKTATVQITQPTLVELSTSSTAVKCFDGTDGTAAVIAKGGVEPYSYRWSSGATTPTVSGLRAGTYQVTVTDASGCVKTASVQVNQPTQIVLTARSTSVTCFNGIDGTAQVTATGGTGSYTYQWSTRDSGQGATTAGIRNLVAGMYTVTVTDGNGCVNTANVEVTQPTEIRLTTQINAISCFGGTEGEVAVQVNGGTGPYAYRWSNGVTTASIKGLVTGTYSVTVADGNGCVKSVGVEVSQPALVVLTTTSTAVNCFDGKDGVATVTTTGGTGNYTYQWSSGATTARASGLVAGTYSVTVTDGNGCVKSAGVDVSQPAPLVLSINSTAIKCAGGPAGTATVTVAGGVGPYRYQWSSGATTATSTGLDAGTYTVTVTDGNGCAKTGSVEITQPTTTKLTVSSTAATCFGSSNGTATVAATGGVGSYSYQWSSGATTPTASDLSAGTYQVTVTDANGCARIASVSVGQPTQVVLSTSGIAVKCFGGNNGVVSVAATGGTGVYSYRWTNPTGMAATTARVSDLVAGTYTITVTDASGCVKTATVDVKQPTLVSLVTSSNSVKCSGGNDGVATVTATGGTGPYSYQWSSGATTARASGLVAGTYSVTVTDGNGCVQTARVEVTQPTPIVLSTSSTPAACFNGTDGTATITASGGAGNYNYLWSNPDGKPGVTTATAKGLTAGGYTVTVTDADGCVKTATVDVSQPSLIQLTISGKATTCVGSSDGSVLVGATGGVEPYTYRWSNRDGGLVGTTASVNNLAAGTYTVMVTERNGCTKVASVQVGQPAPIVLTTTSTAVKCFGGTDGSVMVRASGGTGGYTYRWSTSGATTASGNGLASGTYSVTVTDANGCMMANTVEVTQPERLQFTLQKENVNCHDGSDGKVALNAIGGSGNYQFTVNGLKPANFASATQHLITGLSPDTYQITVIDGNACVAPVQSVTITQPSQPVSISLVAAVNPGGFSLTDGSIQVIVSGGTLPYATTWQNTSGATLGSGQSVADEKGGLVNTLNQLGDNTYTLIVRDANYNLATQNGGCTATFTHRLVEPAKLTLALTTIRPVSCFGRRDARLLAKADGGVPTAEPAKYAFQWFRQQGGTFSRLSLAGPEAQNLTAGIYRCIVTDKNNVSQQADVVVTEPTKLVAAAAGITNNLCANDRKGTAVISMQGGTQPYAVDWSNGATGPALTNVQAGRYLALASDNNGCTAEVTVRIQEPQVLALTVLTSKNPSCNNRCDGQIQTLVRGGVQPYSLSWGSGLPSTAALSNLCGGNYTPTVRDANGCLVTHPAIELVTPAVKTLTISPDRTLCEGQTLQLDATQPGTNTYTWQFPNSNTSDRAVQTLSLAGQYSVTVTDSAGCSARSSFAIRVMPMAGQLSFIMASQGVVGDTIVAVNLSAGTNQFVWVLPGSVRLLSQTVSQVRFVTTQPGTLSIGLRGSNGTCEAELYKTLTIRPASGRRGAQVEPSPAALLVFPNPSSGTFRVQLSFAKSTDARVMIVNAQTGQPVHTQSLSGEATYDVPISLPDVVAGLYIMQVATATEQLTQRLLIVR